MNSAASQLFFLMTTLSRLSNRGRTIDLFVESLENIFPDIGARWLDEGAIPSEEMGCMEVCTTQSPIGWLGYRLSAIHSAVDEALLLNAGQMLASILEKQRQERLLMDQNLHLEALVEERTRHLQQKTEELNRYFEHALELFCIADTNGRFLRLNRQWERTLGYPLDTLVGRSFIDFVHPDDVGATQHAVAELASNRSVEDFVNRYRKSDGSYRWIEWRSFPYGNLIYAAARDITERRKLDESLLRGQKLESIAVLAGGLAHDFNNLLSGIFGFMDLSRHAIDQGDAREASECLGMAQPVFERAKGLTQQLLTFSKGGAPVLRTLSVAELVKHSAEFVLSGSSVLCQCRIAADLWNCDCDENQIGQVVDNIVINARDAMPEGGRVDIQVDNKLGDYGPNRRGRFVCISIKDDGPGMTAQVVSQIFDPFFTTKQTGHGLGLATVFSIVRRHGGWVDVESEPQKGTAFHVYLPASTSPAAASLGNSGAARRACGTVLVMDDERFILAIMDRMLTSMGLQVVKAQDGQAAIDLFEAAAQAGSPMQMCILDLTVAGGIGGAKAATAIRKINPQTVLVAASGYADDPVMANPLEHGFSASLTKPFRRGDLSALVSRWLPPSPDPTSWTTGSSETPPSGLPLRPK